MALGTVGGYVIKSEKCRLLWYKDKPFIQNGLNLLDCFRRANFFLSSSNFFLRLTKSEKQN